ncbi:MAG TPA: hypothetical protein ENI23_00450 [bacterium]|nr:hypothetical protein [bacterium]
MKHISFDESSVLIEYAKIAQEKGFIKEAQQPGEQPPVAQSLAPALPALEQPREQFQSDLDPMGDMRAYPMLYKAYKGQLVAKDTREVKALLNEIQQGALVNLSKKIKPELYNDLRNKVITFFTKPEPMLPEDHLERLKNLAPISQHRWVRQSDNSNTNVKTADEQVGTIRSEHDPAIVRTWLTNAATQIQMAGKNKETAVKEYQRAANYIKVLKADNTVSEIQSFLNDVALKDKRQLGWLPQDVKNVVRMVMGLKTEASKNHETVKQATGEKNYDVTGETGEQLIESAHPGGGTRTELTHSKTEENLIETIVEQQKRDIEVARSIPKGTYAALISLYDVLNKMGHKEYLGGLVKTIKRIATYEDIMINTLLTLADGLDRRGLKNATNHVDKMLEKMAIPIGGQPYVSSPATSEGDQS